MLSINKKKTSAILLGLAVSLSGSVLAAPAATPAADNTDSRIAALEQQQQALAAELKALKKQDAKLKAQTNSQKNQLQGLSSSVKNELARVNISGFGRVSWDNDNIQGYIDRNDNRRFYLDLKGQFHVNDKWNFNFESETNPRYAKYVDGDGNYRYHRPDDDSDDGTIQRVWGEGTIGKAVNVDFGRRWRGLGFQNILLGNETDGVVVSAPIPKSTLKASAFYLTPTDKGYGFSVYGAGVQGQVGHGLQINAAFAKLNIGRNDAMGVNYYAPTTVTTIGSADGTKATINATNVTLTNGTFTSGYLGITGGTEYYSQTDATTGYKSAVEAGVNGIKEGYNLNITNATGTTTGVITGPSTTTTTYDNYRNTAGEYGFVLSAMWNPLKNLFFIGDYVHTDNPGYTIGQWGSNGYEETRFADKDSKAIRLNYRWSNIDNPGSFQIYARWFDYAANINNLVGVFGDKEWGALQPGSHGWVLGFKYVPMKNVEWETFYEFATAHDTRYGKLNQTYHRNFLRTQVDFHF